MPTSLEQKIQYALKQINKTLANLDDLAESEVEAKRAYLDMMLQEEMHNNKLSNPKVFVSFAGSTGRQIFEDVIKRINQTKTPDKLISFHAQHGMRIDGKGESEVRNHILSAMKPCCIFIGILTEEYQLTGGEGRFAPGGWSLFEAGMALSLGLPVIFFFQEGIHDEFWKKYLGDKRHVPFTLKTYQRGLGSLMKRIQEAYRDLRKGSRIT